MEDVEFKGTIDGGCGENDCPLCKYLDENAPPRNRKERRQQIREVSKIPKGRHFFHIQMKRIESNMAIDGCWDEKDYEDEKDQ
jgi:hypothetical protein